MARVEHDPLGEHTVPADAYYGIQTVRAAENFPISGLHAPADLVTATVLIKRAAARANVELGRLEARVGEAIIESADEIVNGALRDQFIVDIYQAGAGTSHNMNVNEVLANRASEVLGGAKGEYRLVHPNDHVNMGQSTNDVFPSATRVALLLGHAAIVDAARALAASLHRKAGEFATILKVGRTHLQDAVPMTLGQEFGGYAACIERGADDVARAAEQLKEMNLGATAVGTGLNAGDEFSSRTIKHLGASINIDLVPAANRFRVTQSMGDVLAYSSAMRRLAVELGKIASDLRLLSMGPRAGLSEIALPAVQPGSSIMPGKVNPSVPEMVNQVCFQVVGCDTTVCMAAEAGHLELNVMMPVIAWNSLHASTILRNAMRALTVRTVDGVTADEPRARELLERSTALATALSPYLGYEKTAEIAKESVATGKPIRQIVLERRLIDASELDQILSVEAMTRPGIAGDKR
ncbi:MAG TPA: aspartate ammonia-lyase [Vicinamibacterales bacterium]|nr:aspartate ammonia-lyase [Vicinamibacterales bacterium]